MGPASVFIALWSHMRVGHGPNSGVISNLEGDVPFHLMPTDVIWNTYQSDNLPLTHPLLHPIVVSQQFDGLVHGLF